MRNQRNTERRTYEFEPQYDSRGRLMLSFWLSRGPQETETQETETLDN